MTSFTNAATIMQTLSMTAMEEASRQSLRNADLEHLFLALVVDSHEAGRALRTVNITLERARDAVEAQHAAQLESIGITVTAATTNRIVFHETGGYEWTPRALDVLKHAGGKYGGDTAAVLRGLLSEPSGVIHALLDRLDVSSTDVLRQLTAESRNTEAGRHHSGRTRDLISRTDVFVPAPIDDVWALLANPSRMPEWDPYANTIQLPDTESANPTAALPGDTWFVSPSMQRPDGKPIRIKEPFRRRKIELVVSDEPSRIGWRITYPDMSRSNTNLLTINLTAASGGCQLQLVSSWTRQAGWRALLRWPLRPIQRLLLWVNMFQMGSGISRVFR